MAEKKQKFEDKITEIESIINDLENGNTNLEEQVNKIVLENGKLEDFKLEDNN